MERVYTPMNSSLQALWHQPVFSSVLNNRGETAAIVGFGVVHIGLNLAGISLWNCPILAATGVPCPGCGLTRATMQLLHGDISSSLQTHAFAPVFLIALFLMVAVLFLPKPTNTKIISFVSRLETRNGITAWGLCLLMSYWVIRLIT
jgi:hypothetical protein